MLDWTEDCLARVDRAAFFARYDMGDAVQYFYEPFLAEFDPELRKDFGVWYTPPEIVRYMVGRVDAALRENFHLPDGLADPSVIVLDPCCGTGAYLVETLRLIRQRLVAGYGETQAALKIREVRQEASLRLRAAARALRGLPPPDRSAADPLGCRPGSRQGRARRCLPHQRADRLGAASNRPRTCPSPSSPPSATPPTTSSSEEQILVIIGNPPYDGLAGVAVEEERALSEAYRKTKAAPAPQGQGLNDLYIRFFRMAERRITEGVPQSDDPQSGPAPRRSKRHRLLYLQLLMARRPLAYRDARAIPGGF